jgi:ribonuclease P protein component
MTVSKRVLPAATQRNSAKRLIRECFRQNARRGVARDVVVRLRKPIAAKERPVAREMLGELLKTILAAK